MSIARTFCAFIKRITDRTSQSAGLSIFLFILNTHWSCLNDAIGSKLTWNKANGRLRCWPARTLCANSLYFLDDPRISILYSFIFLFSFAYDTLNAFLQLVSHIHNLFFTLPSETVDRGFTVCTTEIQESNWTAVSYFCISNWFKLNIWNITKVYLSVVVFWVVMPYCTDLCVVTNL
jgi:hypothetical protein